MADISKITINTVEFNIKDEVARASIEALGVGSGGSIDADTLNGMSAEEFAPAGHSHTEASTVAAGFMSIADKVAMNTLKNLVGSTSVEDQISDAIADKADKNHTHSIYAGISHTHSANDITTDAVSMERGGTGANNGANGLKNLFAAGQTIISPNQYGTQLPSDAAAGRIFFLKV